MRRTRVLFLCTHNSARSQMAEGFLRHLAGECSKTLDRFLEEPWDFVITVCDSAREACPVFPGRTARLHWSFDDPSAALGSDADRLTVFRRVRDEIKERIRTWLARPPKPEPGTSA